MGRSPAPAGRDFMMGLTPATTFPTLQNLFGRSLLHAFLAVFIGRMHAVAGTEEIIHGSR